MNGMMARDRDRDNAHTRTHKHLIKRGGGEGCEVRVCIGIGRQYSNKCLSCLSILSFSLISQLSLSLVTQFSVTHRAIQ